MTAESNEIPPVQTTAIGILQPVFSNRFSVVMKVMHIATDWISVISQQVNKVDVDLVNHTVTLTLEQPIGKPMIELLHRVFNVLSDPTCQTKSNKLTLNYMNGQDGNPTSCDVFTNISPVSHNMTLRYEADTQITLHTCVFKYQSVNFSYAKV